MKNYKNLECAVLLVKVQNDGYTELIPTDVIFGTYDQENIAFIQTNGVRFEHIIYTTGEVGYAYRLPMDIFQRYQMLPSYFLKRHLLKLFYENHYYMGHNEEYDVNCVIIKSKDSPDKEEEYHLCIDDDSIDYYTKKNPDFLNDVVQYKKNEEEENKDKVSNKEKISADSPFTIDIKSLYKELTSQVIGQDEPIQNILGAIWKQYNGFSSSKSRNILINGKTGVGKSAIFRILTKELDIPIVVANATQYTASGYVGLSVDDMLVEMLSRADGSLERAEHGILIIDEIDKLSEENSYSGSVGKRDVQEELLKLIEDGKYTINYRGKKYEFDTSNLMVIAAGSFGHIEHFKKNTVGFDRNESSKEENIDKITERRNTFTSSGMLDELIGRLPIVITMNDLNYDDHIRILKFAKNNILQNNIDFFKKMGITVTIEDGTYEAIARISSQSKFGVREQDTITEEMFSDATFVIASNPNAYTELIVSPETIKNNKKYVLKRKKELS